MRMLFGSHQSKTSTQSRLRGIPRSPQDEPGGAPDVRRSEHLPVKLRTERHDVRQFAGHDDKAAGRIDTESAWLLLGRRAAEIGELAARAIDAEGRNRARRALRGVKKAAVGRKMKIGSPDIVVGVSRRRAG